MALFEFLLTHPLLFASACVYAIVFLKNRVISGNTLFYIGKCFAGLFLGYALILSVLQYLLWLAHPLMRFVLPPHGSMMYVLLYSYHIFFKQILWRIVGATVLLFIMEQLNRMKQQSLFYSDEIATVSFLALLIDFPLHLLLLPLGFLGILMVHVRAKAVKEKASFQPYWKYAGGALLLINIYVNIFNLYIILQP